MVVDEQAEVTRLFAEMLHDASKDGGRKRDAGAKIPWQIDKDHEAAVFSHLNKWKHGFLVDEDSGAHPLVHLAWRALAIAWQETHPEEAHRVASAWYTQNLASPAPSVVDPKQYPEPVEDDFSREFWDEYWATVHGDSPL